MSAQFGVKLHVYDLSRGLAKQMSHILLGKQIDGVWHTGIVVYEKEFFFGSGGIEHCPPNGTILGDPDEVKDLGVTNVPEDVFHQYLVGLTQNEFQPERYNLFEHNCNTFSNEAAQFLTGRTIPKHIQDLPRDILNTPFGSMIKPIFDSLSVRPYSLNSSTLTPNEETNADPNSIFEPRLSNPGHAVNDSDSFISEGPKVELKQSKDVPVIYNDYQVSSLVASLELTTEKCELKELEIQQVKEIEEALQSKGKDKVKKNHLQLLENLLEKYEYSGQNNILTNIVQALGLLVLKDDIIMLVCQDPVSKPVFKLAREFPRLNSLDVQCAVIELFTNICSTDVGRGIFVAEEEPEETNSPPQKSPSYSNASSSSRPVEKSVVVEDGIDTSCSQEGLPVGRKGSVVEQQQAIVDHRDVVQLTVKAILHEHKELYEKAAALVYNISMAKVSEESALECASAILECLRKNDSGTESVYHCLFALKNFMKISPELVNLTNVIGIDLPKFVKLSKKIEDICNELEQYLIV